MGEIFFKRLFVLFLLVVGLFFSMYAIKDNETFLNAVSDNLISGFAVHPLYSSFSSPESGFIFNNNTNLVSVLDTAVYGIGYYSANGAAWQSFTLAGTSYASGSSWLTGATTATLPSFGVGEHYVIIYSCTYSGSWDCHGDKWQLIVVNNSVSSSPLSVAVFASSFETGNVPSNVLDGDINTRWSALGVGEWIQFNFSSPQTFNQVSVAFLDSNIRLSYFNITVSNNGVDWNTVYSGQSSGTSLGLENFSFSNVTVSYLRIVGRGNSVNTWNSYKEVSWALVSSGVVVSLPNCSDGIQNGNETGVDCGGSCSACIPSCVPSCTNKQCGSNGCSGSCGTCSGTQTCTNYICVTPAPLCGDGQCNGGELCSTCSSDCGVCVVPGNYLRTFYVSNNGSDSNAGTSPSTAWKTIDKVNKYTLFRPGDGILFETGGTWRETLTVPKSGNATNYITFSSYGEGDKPKILGSVQATGWTQYSATVWKSSTNITNFYSANGAEVFFEYSNGTTMWGKNVASIASLTADYQWTWSGNNIYVYDNSTSGPSSKYKSVEVPQRADIISLNQKEYVEINGFKLFYGVTGVKGSDYPTLGYRGAILRNSEIAYLGSKWLGTENPGYGTHFVYNDMLIEHNIIHDCGRRSISINHYGDVDISNIIVQYNTLYNGYHTTGVDLATGSGSFTGDLDDIYIRNNLMYDLKDRPESDGSFSELNWVQGPHGGTGQVFGYHFYNNILMYTNADAIAFEDVDESYVYNNVFYGHNTKSTSNTVDVSYRDGSTNAVLKNNIFYTDLSFDDNSCGVSVSLNPDTQDYHQVEADNNLYFRINSGLRIIDMQGSAYVVYYMGDILANHLGKLQMERGWELHSPVPANPLFVNPAAYNFNVNTGSPAINAGAVDARLIRTEDYEGKPIVGVPDIGAFEHP